MFAGGEEVKACGGEGGGEGGQVKSLVRSKSLVKS